jgi:hypothetical protein
MLDSARICIIAFVASAGVVQWQYRSFPSFGRRFDSYRPLQQFHLPADSLTPVLPRRTRNRERFDLSAQHRVEDFEDHDGVISVGHYDFQSFAFQIGA